MGVVEEWIEAKYGVDAPGSERFKREIGEYHASSVGKCPRQVFYMFRDDYRSEASVYFELGREFEELYGAALAWRYGDFSHEELKQFSNRELIDACDRVLGDVECTIEVPYRDHFIQLEGESDWVILAKGQNEIDRVDLTADGDRYVTFDNGEKNVLEDVGIEKVIETKTTKEIGWRQKWGHHQDHEYQLRTYMWAFDCPGELVYLTRNALEEMVFEFTQHPIKQRDLELRVQRLHLKLSENELPDAAPPRDNICKYCEWHDECQSEGGTRWQ